MLRRLALIAVLSTLVSTARAQTSDWLAVGDALVDGGTPDGLERALEAYARVDPSGPQALHALERRAFVNFLLGRMATSVACYVPLLDRLHYGRDVGARDEALVVLASILADPDWDRDGVRDGDALSRLEDVATIPADRPWLDALYFAVARSLYFASRDTEAIRVIDRALARWSAPEHGTPLASACRRHRARPTSLPDEVPAERTAVDAICARHGL